MAKVIERVEAHYEVRQAEMGTVYRWRPESVVLECGCGEELTLTASGTACIECGEDHAAFVTQVLEAVRPGDEVDHPWRLVHPYYGPARGT